jgi:hypothetical protein
MNEIVNKVEHVRELIRELIISESKTTDLINAHPDIEHDIIELSHCDVTPTKKHLPWMVKMLREGVPIVNIISFVTWFYRNSARLEERDINRYDADDVYAAAHDVLTTRMSRRSDAIRVKKEGAELVYEDEHQRVYLIKTEEASKLYGKGTRWCTTKNVNNDFDSYTASNLALFYVIAKGVPRHPAFGKVAIVTRKGDWTFTGIYDSRDCGVTEDMFNEFVPNGKKILYNVTKLSLFMHPGNVDNS